MRADLIYRLGRIGGIALIVIGIAPLALSRLAWAFAWGMGCDLGEAPLPCVIGARDLGPALYQLHIAGWLILMTLPLGMGGLTLWLISRPPHQA